MRLVLCMIAIVVGLGGSALAQKGGDKKKAAKEYVDAGVAAQDSGDYDTAITLYQKAYQLVPHPTLHFNIAQAQRLAGRAADALASYRLYLSEDPKGKQAKQAKQFIAELEVVVAAEEEARIEAAADAETARLKAEEDARLKAKADADAVAERARLDEEARQQAEADAAGKRAAASKSGGGWSGMRIAGVATGGAGVIALGAGVFFGMSAGSISDELSQPGAMFDPARVDQGKAAERNMFIAYGAGAALVAGGALLFVLGGSSSSGSSGEAQVRVSPAVGPALTGLAVAGRF